MGGFKVTTEIGDISPLLRALEGVKEGMQRRWLRKGVTKGVRELAKEMKATAPVLKNRKNRYALARLLRKSIGQKVVTYKSGVVAGIAGPRRGYKVQIGTVKKGKHAGTPIYADPVSYAHLVELGTKKSSAQPFMRRALESRRAVILGIIADTVRQEMRTYLTGVKK